jgi:ribonucleoside-diphosphate reductase alpha chain
LDHPEFALANNSVAYTEKPDVEAFMREWSALVESKSGERGIFNREASKRQAAKNGRRDAEYSFGTNPCSEIILRDRQFCNLSEVVVRAQDTFDDLKRKVRLATILGTLQSTLTDFRYLSKAWKDNTEEEQKKRDS